MNLKVGDKVYFPELVELGTVELLTSNGGYGVSRDSSYIDIYNKDGYPIYIDSSYGFVELNYVRGFLVEKKTIREFILNNMAQITDLMTLDELKETKELLVKVMVDL